MRNVLVSVFAAVTLFASGAAVAQVGVGVAGAKAGYGLDLTYDLGQESMVHGMIGQTDKIEGSDKPQVLFGSVDYDLTAAISKNVGVYAGLGLGVHQERGIDARLPIGIMATFDRFPVQVALETARSMSLSQDASGRRTFTDHSLAVRYLIK